jgi:hypothetical protein
MIRAARIGAIVGLMTLFALPSVAAAAEDKRLSRGEMIDGCVKMREKAFECKEAFIDAMIDLRAKYQKRIARAIATPEGRAKVKEIGIKEITEDGSGELAPRQKKCAQKARKQRRMPRAAVAPMEACYEKADCAAKISCMMPIMERMMFGKRRGKAQPKD